MRQLTGQPLGAAGRRTRGSALVSGFGMINYDRGLCSGAAILAAAEPDGDTDAMDAEAATRPKRKNPILRTRLPTLPPARAAASRSA